MEQNRGHELLQAQARYGGDQSGVAAGSAAEAPAAATAPVSDPAESARPQQGAAGRSLIPPDAPTGVQRMNTAAASPVWNDITAAPPSGDKLASAITTAAAPGPAGRRKDVGTPQQPLRPPSPPPSDPIVTEQLKCRDEGCSCAATHGMQRCNDASRLPRQCGTGEPRIGAICERVIPWQTLVGLFPFHGVAPT